MTVVVSCPGCRGAAQVAADAVGQLVVCPRCHDPFLAVAAAEPPADARPPERRTPPASRPGLARSRPRRASWAEPVAPPPDPDPTHPDPHAPAALTAGGLPVSVLVGLALIPFTIPLLWLIGPLVLGHQPALSVAAPAALAVSASVLCLAVVYTVDWSPATRIKGVLILVGLAYFAGLSLFFLKPEVVAWVKKTFGAERDWKEFHPDGAGYRVTMPRHPARVNGVGPLPGWNLTCYQATHEGLTETVVFVVGSGPDPEPGGRADSDRWFRSVARVVGQVAGADPGAGESTPSARGDPGRQWEFSVPRSEAVRVVRVYRAKGMVYYLSAEGEHLDPHDELPRLFFNSFLPDLPKE